MFDCRDITQRICKYLEACDVFNLMRANKRAHEAVSALLIGATVGRVETIGDTTFVIVDIPLLDIRETFPVKIISAGSVYNISRVLRVRELRAEVVYVSRYSQRLHTHTYVYVVNDQVKHYICVSDVHGTFHPYTPLRVYSLRDVLNRAITGDLHVKYNYVLLTAIRARGIGAYSSEDEALDALPFTLRILTTETFLRFVVGFDE